MTFGAGCVSLSGLLPLVENQCKVVENNLDKIYQLAAQPATALESEEAGKVLAAQPPFAACSPAEREAWSTPAAQK